jgi:hypothetical protein
MTLSLAVSCRWRQRQRGGGGSRAGSASQPGPGNRARQLPAAAGSWTVRAVPARPGPAGEPFTLVEPQQVWARGYRSQSLSFSSACLINGRVVTCSCWSTPLAAHGSYRPAGAGWWPHDRRRPAAVPGQGVTPRLGKGSKQEGQGTSRPLPPGSHCRGQVSTAPSCPYRSRLLAHRAGGAAPPTVASGRRRGGGRGGPPSDSDLVPADTQNAHIWVARALIGTQPTPMQLGGYSRAGK